jgi:uncharacterized protein involved in exopolysaccharide biosynthesis
VNQAAYDLGAPDADLRQILDRHGLKSLGLEDAKKRLTIQRGRSVPSLPNTTLVTVAFDSQDALIAQAVTRDYMDHLMKRLESPGVAAQAIDPPALPSRPMSPNWQTMIPVGFLFGLTLGGIVVLLKRRTPIPSTYQ